MSKDLKSFSLHDFWFRRDQCLVSLTMKMPDASPEVPSEVESELVIPDATQPNEGITSDVRVEDAVSRMLPKLDQILDNMKSDVEVSKKLVDALGQLETYMKVRIPNLGGTS